MDPASLPSPDAEPFGRDATRRAHALLGLKLFAGLVIIAAPIYLANHFVTGLFGVAFFGVLAATFGWMSGGPRVGVAVAVALSLVGLTSIMVRDSTWVLALILLVLGALYGYAASRGVGKAVMQLPILAPYFMMAPPTLFTDPPTIDAGYFVSVLVIMNISGLWAILVLHLALGHRSLQAVHVPDRRVPLLMGSILGVFSAIVMAIGTGTELKSHWVWVTLTLYLLVDPVHLLSRKTTLGRVLGTFAGFAAVAVLALVGIPDQILQMLAPIALWCCLFYLVLKKPYWQYIFFLTISVVLMNSRGVNTLLLDAERFAFTVVGAALALVAAYFVSLVITPKVTESQLSAEIEPPPEARIEPLG